MNFNSIDDVINGILKLMDVPKAPDAPIPAQLVIGSVTRPGLSAQQMAAEIIRRKAEAGIPVGLLPDGSVAPDEQMEIIRMQVLIEHLTTKAKITVAIEPGITSTVAGTAGVIPVVGVGTSVSIATGNAIIS